jgi:gliding motility-associated-like protein
MNTPLTFTNTSSLGISGNYLWTFDVGASIASTGAFQPSIAYSTSGIHTITLKSTSPNGLCSHDTTKTIFVDNPKVTFTITPTYSCSEPRTFQFKATASSPVTKWMWGFGDFKSSVVQNPSHTFSIPDSIYSKRGRTIFNNTLTIETASGCNATYSAKDTIHLVWARFQPDTAQGCAPLLVKFSDSSHSNTPKEPLASWDYDFGDGSPHGTVKNPSHTYATPGKYKVVLIATNSAGCKDTSYAITISVGKHKALDFIADNLNPCPGDPVTFTHNTADTAGVTGWNYQSNGESLSSCFQDQNPTMVFNDSIGLQTITMTADYNGCLTTVKKVNYITVKGPIAHFDYLTTCGATSYTVQFTDKSASATGLSWDFGDVSPLATTTGMFSHAYTTSGDYKVELTATNVASGCAPSKDSAVVYIRKIKAKFSTDTTLCVGVPIPFDASASTDVYGNCYHGYTWIFSDPTIRPVSYQFPNAPLTFNAGEQNVGLVVTDINGCEDTLKQHIKVYSTAAVYTISDAIICTPDTIKFTDISVPDTTIVKWAWTFGDGKTDFVKNPTHIYPSVPFGTNSLTTKLTITDTLGCISTSTQNISIYKVSSTVSTAPVSPNVCLGTPIVFTASDFTTQGSSLSYKWDYKDGTTDTGNNKSHTYAGPGQYIVKLYYTEKASGCFDSITSTVSVQNYPKAGFSTSVDTLKALCNPQPITFKDTSTVGIYSFPSMTRVWDFANGSGPITTYSPTFTFLKGSYSVKLTETTTNGCVDSIRKSFVVVGPKGDFTLANNNICKGDTIGFTIKDTSDVGSYTWDFGDGTNRSNVSPVKHQYNYLPPGPPLGQGIAKLIVYGQGGVCPVSTSKPINIRYVKADFTRSVGDKDSTVCLGNAFTITDSSKNADVYSWNLGDGITSASKVASFNHLYTSIGTYNISLAVKNTQYGCVDTMIKKVIVNTVPTVKAIGDSVCRDALAHLTVSNYSAAYTYSWKDTAGLSNANVYNPTLKGSITKDYYVTATIPSTGCSSKDTATIFVVQPLVGINLDTSIVIGQYVTLPINNQNGLVNFNWTPTTGLSCLACSNPLVQPLDDIMYSAFMSDILGCFTATSTFKIHIFPETFVKLPTTFTPNGDGVNDVIYVQGWGLKDLLTFEIYNRWGELVFKTSELTEGWDGYYKGMLQNNDIYVYKVAAQTYRNTEISYEGHFNLMR